MLADTCPLRKGEEEGSELNIPCAKHAQFCSEIPTAKMH